MTSSAQALSISLLTFRISPSFESYYNTKVQCGREKSYRRERKHASGKHFPPQGKRYFLPAKNNFRKKLLSVNRFLHKPGLSFLADRKRASIFVNTKKKRPWKKTKTSSDEKQSQRVYTGQSQLAGQQEQRNGSQSAPERDLLQITGRRTG